VVTVESSAAHAVEMGALKAELEEAKLTIVALTGENEELQTKVATVESSAAHAVEMGALKAELEEAKLTIVALTGENEELQTKVEAMQEARNKRKKEHASLQKELDQLKIIALQEELKEADIVNMDHLANELKEAKNTIDTLLLESEDLQTKVAVAASESRSTDSESMDALKADLDAAKHTIIALSGEKKAMQAKVEAMQEARNTRKKEYAILQREFDQLKIIIADLSTANEIGNDDTTVMAMHQQLQSLTMDQDNSAGDKSVSPVNQDDGSEGYCFDSQDVPPPEEGPIPWEFDRMSHTFPLLLHHLTKYFPEAASIVQVQVTLEDGTVALKDCIQFHDNKELQKVLKRCDGDLKARSKDNETKWYRKFTKVLPEWGFISVGQGQKTWRHNDFVGGRPDLAAKITRPKI
jgi:myosin heavy subunit